MGKLLFVVCVLVHASCFRATRHQHTQAHGSCAGACTLYVTCKGPEDPAARHRACVHECQYIFEEGARVDSESLGDFERLSCDEAVKFIDGSAPAPSVVSSRP